jgi:PST family polysaccharide transporter
LKLIKTSFLSAVITFIKIASGFIASKVIAIFTGPSGVALIGTFTNFITIVLTFANGAINTGVIKYTAEDLEDESKIKKLFSTSLRISIVCSFLTAIVLVLFARWISNWVFSGYEFSLIIRLFGLTVILYSLNTLLISILNGRGDITTYAIVNAIGSLTGLILTVFLVYLYKINGALYALIFGQSIVFFVTATLIFKSTWFSWEYFKESYDSKIAKQLSRFSLMAIVTALTLPVTQIIIRNMITTKLGVDSAGYWQGMMRVSDGYLLLITTSLNTYYLPKLSALKDDKDLKKEIYSGYKIILPAVFLGCLLIYLCRLFIIKTLYTPSFLPMENLFFWQLLGDFIKMASFVLAYMLLAKAMTKLYIITEILFNIIYLLLSYFLIDRLGLPGVTIAFALNYTLYLILMLIVFKRILFTKIKI